MINTVEGRELSEQNSQAIQRLAILRGKAKPTLVGGYKQWRDHGRQVKQGEHGYRILFPVGKKDSNGELSPERFLVGIVFDVSQVE